MDRLQFVPMRSKPGWIATMATHKRPNASQMISRFRSI